MEMELSFCAIVLMSTFMLVFDVTNFLVRWKNNEIVVHEMERGVFQNDRLNIYRDLRLDMARRMISYGSSHTHLSSEPGSHEDSYSSLPDEYISFSRWAKEDVISPEVHDRSFER